MRQKELSRLDENRGKGLTRLDDKERKERTLVASYHFALDHPNELVSLHIFHVNKIYTVIRVTVRYKESSSSFT
jgi:hypothetical protein